MGWFTKAIPERKWAEVSADLGLTLKKEATTWYSVFRKQSAVGKVLSSSTLTDSATHKVHLLQLQAVASAIQEGGYIADSTFFLELVYIVLTGRRPAELHSDLEANPFCTAGSAEASLLLWAQALVAEFPEHEQSAESVRELTGYGAFAVARATVATCMACGDKKRAEVIRNSFVGKA